MASKKLRAVQNEGDDDTQVDMSPMIDMVFLLLIFFLVNATLIIVEMDKRIKVPIAKHALRQENKQGRIVINVYGDQYAHEGRFRQADGKTKFDDEDAMKKFINEEREVWELKGQTPRLHLRADGEVHFKYVRQAIRAAAAAKVKEVIFIGIFAHN